MSVADHAASGHSVFGVFLLKTWKSPYIGTKMLLLPSLQ